MNKVLRNYNYLWTSNVISSVISVFSVYYVSRLLSVPDFGKVSWLSEYVGYFAIIASWGFNVIGVKELADNKPSTFTRIMSFKILFGLMAFIMMFVTSFFMPMRSLTMLFSFTIITSTVFDMSWYFQGVQRMEYIGYFNVIKSCVYLLVVVLFLKSNPLTIPASLIVCELIPISVALLNIKDRFRFTIDKTLFVEARNIGLTSLVSVVILKSPIMILGILSGTYQVGLFSAAFKIAWGVFALIGLFVTSIYPIMNKVNVFNRWLLLSLSGIIAVSVALFSFSGMIINTLYGYNYREATPLLQILSGYIVFHYLTMYSSYYLWSKSKGGVVLIVSVIQAVFTVALCVVAIEMYGTKGVCYTMIIQNMLFGLILFYKAWETKPGKGRIR